MHGAAFDLTSQEDARPRTGDQPGDFLREAEPRQAAVPAAGEDRAAAEFAGLAIMTSFT